MPFPLFLRSFLSFCRLFRSPPLFPPASHRYSHLSLPLSPPPPPPPATLRVLRARTLSRDQPSLPCFLLRSLLSALLSRFISFFRHPPLRRARTRTYTGRALSLSLSLSFPLFPVPTTKNVANVRIDRSLSRALLPFFTLLPSASPLLLLLFLLHLPPLRPLLTLFLPPPPPPFVLLSSSATLSTLPSDLLYHIRHQHYTRALISSVGNSAFLAISLLL